MKQNFKQTALSAAKSASKVLLHYYGKKEVAREKSNKTLVAAADLEANKIIIKTIKRYFPSHSILSEETGFEDNKSDYKWVIDPLDGTHNFLHRIPLFGTSIALEYKNGTILGILHFPVLKITAFAEKGKGAFLNGKRIKVSNKNNLHYSFILTELSKTSRKTAAILIKKLFEVQLDVRSFGAAIYNLLQVAEGNCEGYVVFTTKEWDMAAGFLIVEEAGGKITDFDGRKYSFAQGKFVVSNGKVHKILLNYLK